MNRLTPTEQYLRLRTLRLVSDSRYFYRVWRSRSACSFLEDLTDIDIDADRKIEFVRLAKERHRLEAQRSAVEGPARIRKAMRRLGVRLGLDNEDQALAVFLFFLGTDHGLRQILASCDARRGMRANQLVAQATALPVARIRVGLSSRSPLLTSGMFSGHLYDRDKWQGLAIASEPLVRRVLEIGLGPGGSIPELGMPSPRATLKLRDFDHLESSPEWIAKLLARAKEEGRRGVNVLLHGPPGTGKTEMSRLVSALAGHEAIELPTVDEDQNPLSSEDRLKLIRPCQGFHAVAPAVLVIDEAEDILGDGHEHLGSPARGRKAWLHRLIESTPTPTIWITNSGDAIDPATARRFDFVLRMGAPPREKRHQILAKAAGRVASPETLLLLAREEGASPAAAARAAAFVRATGAESSAKAADHAFRVAVSETLKVQGVADPFQIEDAVDAGPAFDIRFLNASPDPAEFLDKLREGSPARLCLHGPPGTGKTAFGRWLAAELDRPLHTASASEILSPLVGMSEHSLARAFHRAQRDGAILLLDEIDTFLQPRDMAQRSWEVSLVNEMLLRMERFDGLLIASTNREQDLDPAAYRRFDLRIKLGTLTGHQCEQLLASCCRHLDIGKPGRVVRLQARALSGAVPGDFAQAARQHRFRSFADAKALLEAVVAESLARNGRSPRSIGFARRG